MSIAHKGSRLLLSGNIIPVDYQSTHFDYSNDATGIRGGQLILPSSASIYTWRQAEGRFGNGIAVEEGTTNLWTGPMNIYNNFASNGQMTATLVALNETFMGQTVYRLQMTPISANAVTSVQGDQWSHGVVGSTMNYQSGNTYISSIYWRAYKSDIHVGGTASNVAGWSDVGTYSTNSGWNRSVSKMYNTQSGGATDSKYWSFWSPSTVANETITIDWVCPQIEQKAFPTSYTTSTRGYGLIDYGDSRDFINPLSHTISMWVNSGNFAIGGGWNIPFSLSSTFYIGIQNGNNMYVSVVDANNTQRYYSYSYNFSINTWYHIGYSFNNGTIKMYINGSLVNTVSIPTSSVHFDTTSGTRNLYIGSWYTTSTDAWNGIINDIRIDKYALSDEDFMAICISNRPLYNPYDYRATAY